VPLSQRGYSDGRYEIYQAMKQKLSDGWGDPRAEKISFVTVDTGGTQPRLIKSECFSSAPVGDAH